MSHTGSASAGGRLLGGIASQAPGQGQLGEPGDVVDANLLHERFAVAAHSLEAEVEEDGDFLAGFSVGDQAHHLHFARAQMVARAGGILFLRGGPLKTFEQAIGDLGAEVGAALGNGTERVDEIAVGGAFEDEAAGAEADGADDGLFIVVHGEDDDFGFGGVPEDFGGGVDAVESGQAEIHDDDWRMELAHELDGLFPGFAFTGDSEVGRLLEDSFQAIPHDLVIVDEEDVHHERIEMSVEEDWESISTESAERAAR